jgi:hypothetical protein
MSSSTLSLTSTLNGVGCQRHAPTALALGKTRYPLHRRLGGGGLGTVWMVVENFTSTRIRTPERPARTQSL